MVIAMKTAFVTGGSGDIGSEICFMLAEQGYAVAVGYCNSYARAEDICSEINRGGGIAAAVRFDAGDLLSVQKNVHEISAALAHPEVLVNCAAVSQIGLFTDLSDEELIQIVNVDLMGAMLAAKAALPEMIRRRKGKIINISSVWGEVGASCETAYSAAKAGLIGFTKALAKEAAPSGINVNCISAGMIDTKMNSSLSESEISDIVMQIPAGRMGTPVEVANAVKFLISDKSSYINGQTIRLDGAWL